MAGMKEANFTLSGVAIKRESDAAVLVVLPEGDEVWLPKSQIDSMDKRNADGVTIVMSAWIAKQKGLL
jgi:hypothetical protein